MTHLNLSKKFYLVTQLLLLPLVATLLAVSLAGLTWNQYTESPIGVMAGSYFLFFILRLGFIIRSSRRKSGGTSSSSAKGLNQGSYYGPGMNIPGPDTKRSDREKS